MSVDPEPKRKVKKYTERQKVEALEIYRTEGPAVAHEKTKIPAATIFNWASKRGVLYSDSMRALKTVKDGHIASYAPERSMIVQKLIARTNELLDRMNKPHIAYIGKDAIEVRFDFPPASDVKNLALAIDRLIDKYRLELGEMPGKEGGETKPGVSGVALTVILQHITNLEDPEARARVKRHLMALADPEVIEGEVLAEDAGKPEANTG